MKIEDILKNAGIEDADAIAKVAAEMPKSFMPLEVANTRIGEAKKAHEEATKALEELKAEAEKMKQQEAQAEGEGAKELEALRKQYEELETKFTAAQDDIKQTRARTALEEALTKAGANPAAIKLMVDNGLKRVEFDDAGKPANIQDAAEAIKADNAALFGVELDTGKKQEKGEELPDESLFEGFGDTERK